MPPPGDTLEKLWAQLSLDAPAQAAQSLRATRRQDWSADTIRVDRASTPTPERTDLPRVTLLAPALPDEPEAPETRDLTVVGLLGEGGMGRVLLARQAALDRDVAVKIPLPGASAGTVRALVHEARVTGALEHPGVIPVYALASDTDGRPALVMKRVDGVPWDRLLSDESDPAWERVLARGAGRLESHVDILIHVCNAVAFAHSRGVLHRDLKPANVLVGEFGEVYVADWGIAARKPAPGEVRPPHLVGTPCYLPPEMVTGDDAQIDERSDVFLLGATLYEVLAGRPPWLGKDLQETLREAWSCGEPPLPAGTPEELQRICRKAMAPAPADRYQTAVELRDALGGFLRHRSSIQLTQAALERLDTVVAHLRAGELQGTLVYPLLSECRFGFAQALREWPENEVARAGLQDALEAAARYEVKVGNAAAARAHLHELHAPPADLVAAIEGLEQDAANRAAEAKHIRHLSKEFDPRISGPQWVAFVVVIALASVLISASRYVPGVEELIARHAAAYMLLMMTTFYVVFWVGLWLGRRSLLATRVNRRITGLLGVAATGAVLNRLLALKTGLSVPQTLVTDLLLIGTASVVGGLTLHWGVGVAGGILCAGAVAVALVPQAGLLIFNITCVVALLTVALTRRYWRSELGLEDDAAPKGGPT